MLSTAVLTLLFQQLLLLLMTPLRLLLLLPLLLQAKAQFNKMRGVWVERRRSAMDVIENISESMDKKTKQVMDLMGIELEPKNFEMPPKMT
jgi:uncharacterized lipoprotein YddW (UPF0748 family)